MAKPLSRVVPRRQLRLHPAHRSRAPELALLADWIAKRSREKFLGDKDIRGITATLAADVDAWILVALDGPRAVNTRQLAAQLPPNAPVIHHAIDVADGCREARNVTRPGDRVLVFGSFLTVGPALEFLGL